MSRKRRTVWKLRLPLEALTELAPEIWPPHASMVSERGYTLKSSSGLWRKRNGTLTARLAYRHRDGLSLAVTVRNITIESDTVTEDIRR